MILSATFSSISFRTGAVLFAAITIFAAGTFTANAQKLYKITDENGNVSYQDKPPLSKGPSMEERQLESGANRLRNSPAKSPSTAATKADKAEERPLLTDQEPPVPEAAGSDGQGDASAFDSEPISREEPYESDGLDLTGTDGDALSEGTYAERNPRSAAEESDRTVTAPEIIRGPVRDENTENEDQLSAAEAGKQRNSRGRVKAPENNSAETDSIGGEKRALTSEELADIARSLGKE